MRVLAVGPRELISGLAAFGVAVRHATEKEDAMAIIKETRAEQSRSPYAIIFITESLASGMSESEYEIVIGEELPVVLTIPDLSSDKDAGLAKLRALTKRAVGIDIFGGN